jgi:glycosyltransferase involved in cell wall biosynthesis
VALLFTVHPKDERVGSSGKEEPRSTQEDKNTARQMISVIIPLMPIMPYTEQIETTLRGLERQTADTEVIVCEQPVERWINKGKLLNEGFAKSTGDIIFHCDADIIFKDETVLERMEKKLEECDVVYPMFFSPFRKCLKIADGHPFMRPGT